MNISQLLKEIGFQEKEITIYLLLAKKSRLTPAEIAMQTKINRATVYNIVKELISKGIVAEDLAAKTMTIVALPPDRFKQMLAPQKRELKEKEERLDQVIKEIALMNTSREYPVPKIRFVEESKIEDFLYQEAQKWDQSAQKKDGTWWGFQDHHLVEQYEKWLRWLWKEVHATTAVKILSNDTPFERKIKSYYPKRSIKTLAQNQFNATTWVVGEYLVMLVSE